MPDVWAETLRAAVSGPHTLPMNSQQSTPRQPSPDPRRPSRRVVLHAVAWTAPAIVVVGAAPAFATTPGTGAPSSIAVWHTPVQSNETIINVSNLSASPVTATIALPLYRDGDSPHVWGVSPYDWQETGFGVGIWSWSITLQPGQSAGMSTFWDAGTQAGSRQVVVSVGTDDVHALDIEPPFAATGRAAAQRPSGKTPDDVVMAPNHR